MLQPAARIVLTLSHICDYVYITSISQFVMILSFFFLTAYFCSSFICLVKKIQSLGF